MGSRSVIPRFARPMGWQGHLGIGVMAILGAGAIGILGFRLAELLEERWLRGQIKIKRFERQANL